jgi:hypothetical protein
MKDCATPENKLAWRKFIVDTLGAIWHSVVTGQGQDDMTQTATYRTEELAGHTFEWTNTEYRSPTGGDHVRQGYRLDGKRAGAKEFYKALIAARDAGKETS